MKFESCSVVEREIPAAGSAASESQRPGLNLDHVCAVEHHGEFAAAGARTLTDRAEVVQDATGAPRRAAGADVEQGAYAVVDRQRGRT